MIKNYGKISTLGHRLVGNILDEEVIVEEKLDGSQFSFSLLDGKLWCRSRNVQMDVETGQGLDGMFSLAIQSVLDRKHLLVEGYTYRGEYLRSKKHNTLTYNSVPAGFISLFDVDKGDQSYVSYEEKAAIAKELGLDVVPLIYQGKVSSVEQVKSFLDRESYLGGPPIEGVVIKSLSLFDADRKRMMAKYVSEAFKEVHNKDWKNRNPTRKDVLLEIIDMLKTDARYEKAVQHLRDQDLLDNSPKDIGPLIRELNDDLVVECEDMIKNVLFAWAIKDIKRGVSKGFPEWYKEKLLASAFEEKE